MRPNFLIAGGVASGTSFLSAALKQHPEVYLPKADRPEPNFFHYSWKFANGIDWYEKTWFGEVNGETAVGERSSLLLNSPEAPMRILESLPDVKLIFCLRDPIERAWANYRFSVLEGLEPLDFDVAIELESVRTQAASGKWSEVQPHAYITRSRYSSHLRAYQRLFGKDRILTIKSEDLSESPGLMLQNVCSFLGVDMSFRFTFPPAFTSPSVVNRDVQVRLRNEFGEKFSEIIETIRTETDFDERQLSSEELKNLERLRLNLRLSKEILPIESRNRLEELLEEEINEVESLVDFSISDWRTERSSS